MVQESGTVLSQLVTLLGRLHLLISQVLQLFDEADSVMFVFIRRETTAIVLGVIALLFISFSVFMLTVLYRRGLAIRRKRAMRRYMESGAVSQSLVTLSCCCASLCWFLTFALCA